MEISCCSSSLASQTHFRKKGKGLVNYVYKPCPTGMQLAGWRNQISNNTLLNYLLQSKHAPWKLFSKCFYGCCSSGKDVLALIRCFQDCYCYSKQWCNVSCDKILQHDWTALYSAAGQGLYTQFTRPFPLLRKWVWLARLLQFSHHLSGCGLVYGVTLV